MALSVFTLSFRCLLTGAALLVAPAWAQSPLQSSTTKAARSHPLDARAEVPLARYVSPLAHFRPLGDSPSVAWKDANDTVARIGGWRAYARETQPSPASAGVGAAASAPAPSPASSPATVP